MQSNFKSPSGRGKESEAESKDIVSFDKSLQDENYKPKTLISCIHSQVVAPLLLFGVVAAVVLLFAPRYDQAELSEVGNSTLTAIHHKLLIRAT
ncbi:hypothetical protein C1H46_038576 [Malus baccata]|uniref:Uncharacterized protein n=1 Tax=Malus baccata TaxID=106549 RepID=A0A540KNV3_MALBA|nr:hypothetical protein C1H46_038576 [Malus baccata]